MLWIDPEVYFSVVVIMDKVPHPIMSWEPDPNDNDILLPQPCGPITIHGHVSVLNLFYVAQ